METKDLVGLGVFFAATLGGMVVTCASHRVRDLAFFLMLALTVVTRSFDINFMSHFWYRGTTRGLEFSLVDVFAISVLASSMLFPRPGESRWYWPGSLAVMLLFFAYSCGSVLFAEPKIYGLFELVHMMRGLIFFLAAAWFVRGERELLILVLGLCCAVCFEGLLAAKQRWLGGVYRPPGSLEHPNILSTYLCLVAPILVAASTSTLPRYARRFAIASLAVAALGVLLTISRAGIPIFALVTLGATGWCISWRLTVKKTRRRGARPVVRRRMVSNHGRPK